MKPQESQQPTERQDTARTLRWEILQQLAAAEEGAKTAPKPESSSSTETGFGAYADAAQ